MHGTRACDILAPIKTAANLQLARSSDSCLSCAEISPSGCATSKLATQTLWALIPLFKSRGAHSLSPWGLARIIRLTVKSTTSSMKEARNMGPSETWG
ncbi:hypothetical protein AMTR_s00005p00087110 [Amborella trichopoda]|uniref:Uncharacterized protein n=1 Tax=Amborella trichopoda TaxID=13333 RepID=W1PA36_AMBTC|nr:hypothetical protein AMTR_s00005p00087110 [Amborella trichopoda]